MQNPRHPVGLLTALALSFVIGHTVAAEHGSVPVGFEAIRVVTTCPSGIRVLESQGHVYIETSRGGEPKRYSFDPFGRKPYCGGPIRIRIDGKVGYVGLDGHRLFDARTFDEGQHFLGGYAAVREKGAWGIVAGSGEVLVPPRYEALVGRRGISFHVVFNGKKLWVDAYGREQPEPAIVYTEEARAQVLQCGRGIRLIEDQGLWGATTDTGRKVVPARHRALVCGRDGAVWAPNEQMRKWCSLPPFGAQGDPRLCHELRYPYELPGWPPESFHSDPFESSVLWNRARLAFGTGRRNAPPR